MVKIDLPKLNQKKLSNKNILINLFFIKNKDVIKYKIIINEKYPLYYSLKLDELKLMKKSNDKFFKEGKNLSEEDMRLNKKKITDILIKNNDKEFKTNDFSNISLGRVAKIPILINLSKKYKNISVYLKYDKKKKGIRCVFHKR